VLDNIVEYNKIDEDFESPYQFIPYCIRPFTKGKEQVTGNISLQITFEELKQEKVNAQNLLLWGAPIDLVESYQNYLNKSNFSFINEQFFNCSPLWFGPFCQYTSNSNQSFNEIVHQTFDNKFSADMFDPIMHLMDARDHTNLSCYIHLKCNRGPLLLCLDWHEICDGRIDCFGDGIDEINCIELEMNECEKNEYRCRNGMCVPEQFLNDNPRNPDCLDRTDENDEGLFNFEEGDFEKCTSDPAFRCEESHHFHLVRNFACGDGTEMYFKYNERIPVQDSFLDEGVCSNGRYDILYYSVLLNTEHSNFSSDCWQLLISAAFGINHNSTFLCSRNQNFASVRSKCNHSNYVILPVLPILQDNLQFGYWANRTFPCQFFSEKQLPDFICYDTQRCPLFLFTFMINNLTCLDVKKMGIISFDQIIRLFQTCLFIDESGNKTHCRHSSLFHCPGTSKCISKHRLLDGIDDCYGGADEKYEDSCNLNQTHRFRCELENKCISRLLVRDGIKHCKDNQDETVSSNKIFSFQNLCNGYVHLSPEFGDEQNETDETNCEQWPCNNQYTRCDGAWTCKNGLDELNCNQSSKCFPNRHECVSPTTRKLICLPVDQAGDGKIDCLGATDEREHCRQIKSQSQDFTPYRCWNDTYCVAGECFGSLACETEVGRTSTYSACINNPDIQTVFNNLMVDEILVGIKLIDTDYYMNYKYFSLHVSNELLPDTRSEYLKSMHKSLSIFNKDTSLLMETKFRQAWICNRGILIYIGIKKIEYCLCPPSYYGNRCQFQSQRVSLTLQFTKNCTPNCFGIYAIVIMLVDHNQVIHLYEQLTYISTQNCNMKYNSYFLYDSRPKDETKNYSIRVDAYNKNDHAYHSSWILPIKFLFLPVNRIAAHLIIPAHRVGIVNNCQFDCGDHGHCTTYVNNGESYCQCDTGWSGVNCIDQDKCNCSLDSLCLGTMNNRSICLCSFNKVGPRCLLNSVCQRDTCKNSGSCIVEDDRTSMNNFTCICSTGYSGSTCEVKDSRIDISFYNIKIPQFILIHLITVRAYDDPLITTIVKKINLDEDTTTVYTSTLFNLLFVNIENEYYLSFIQINATYVSHLELPTMASQYCFPMYKLLDQRTMAFPLLRRVKYYHIACRERSELRCLYDNEEFMCLCNEDRYANCFPFDFKKKSNCQERAECENGGQCVQDISICPSITMCICPECYYGGKCQFTTKGFSLSLDVILAYQIHPHLHISRQRAVINVSIAIASLMLFITLISNTLCIMTFWSEKLREVGCGFYLFILSILSLFSIIILNLKLWIFILSQMSLITNRTFLWINCISIEFLLQSLLIIRDWLTACVAIERVFVIKKDVHFDKKKSKQIARWIITAIVILTMISLIYDPIHRELIDDKEDQRTWCIVRYSSLIRIIDSAVHIFHFMIPFLINLLSPMMIIVNLARTHSNSRKKQTYTQHLKEQLHQKKHLIISSIINVILSIPRLIISFLTGCIQPKRDPWLFLFGYSISFVPSLLTLIVFILPSKIYKKEFDTIIKQKKEVIRRCCHLN
jgi:hypothetical protein